MARLKQQQEMYEAAQRALAEKIEKEKQRKEEQFDEVMTGKKKSKPTGTASHRFCCSRVVDLSSRLPQTISLSLAVAMRGGSHRVVPQRATKVILCTVVL